MNDQKNCIHARFEEWPENKWCIDCGAVEVSPARYYRHISWKHTVTGRKWIFPGSRFAEGAIDSEAVANGYALESNTLRRHQRAIDDLAARLLALEGKEKRKAEVLTVTLKDLADLLTRLRTQHLNIPNDPCIIPV